MRFPSAMPAALALFPLLALSACESAECTSLYDCPEDLFCSRDGACVERARPLPEWNTDAPPGDQNGVVIIGNTDEASGSPVNIPAEARLFGDIGGDVVDRFTTDSYVSEWGVTVTTREGHLVALQTIDSLWPLLRTPGTYRVVESTALGDFSGITCGPGYDEPAQEIEIIVGEANDDGEVTFELDVVNENSDVTAVITVQPPPV